MALIAPIGRNIFGYERLEDVYLIVLMNDIYKNYWCPLKNFYTPSVKLIKNIELELR